MIVTPEKIDEWLALSEAASDGPWLLEHEAPDGWMLRDKPSGSIIMDGSAIDHDEELDFIADAQFVAAARDAVPAMAKALCETRARIEELEKASFNLLSESEDSVDGGSRSQKEAEDEMARVLKPSKRYGEFV